MNVQENSKKGFTIIEVVLVLAIAGLIFLMIFLAWPALQRSQRDTARKNDANVVASAIGDYRGNNRGKNPDATTLDVFRNNYLSELSQYDKTTSNELVIAVGSAAVPTKNSVMNVSFGAKCGANNTVITSGASSRQAAITILLESGGTTGTVVCQDA